MRLSSLRPSKPPVRRGPTVAAAVALFAALSAASVSAQDKPEVATAQALAAAYQLTNADGDRVCPITLKPDPGAGAFQVAFDKAACSEMIAFTVDVTAWTPGPGDSIRLLGPKGVLVVEFTEGLAGTWEGLREEDGVYFLNNPALADVKQVQPGDLFGAWDAARPDGKPICRLDFLEDAAAGGAYGLAVDAGCDASVARFGPVAWRIERGDLVLVSAKGETLRFAAQEDGGWAKVPEGARPLLLTRPPAPAE